MNVLNIHRVFFTFRGYQESYIDVLATIFIMVYTLLLIRKSVWAWPVGIVSFALFAILFYQVELYSEFLAQFYYIVIAFYGCWKWLAGKKDAEGHKKSLEVSYTSGRSLFLALLIIASGTSVLGLTMSKIHIILPSLFPVRAAFPYIDALVTITGFVAIVLMANKKVESWFLLICIDGICSALYSLRGAHLLAIVYVIFLVMAAKGMLAWNKELRQKIK
jgi:nicotinamide mononucleotide transporter